MCEARIICKANITPEGHITMHACETQNYKRTCFRKSFCLVELRGFEPLISTLPV